MQNRKQPPSHLGKCGKANWRKVTAENSFSAAEFLTLELLCAQLDTLDKLDTEMSTMGVVVAGSEGQPVVNPVLRERRETIKQIDQLMVALALPVDGEAFGTRRSGAARAAAKALKPRKINKPSPLGRTS
jgi:phage terminase small subunit